MDNEKKKETLTGLVGTLVVHGVVFLLLWFLFIRAAEPQEESGVPVLLGTEMFAQGGGDRYKMTEVDVRPIPKEISSSPEKNISQTGEKIISQDMEETVAIEPKKEEKKVVETTPKQTIEPVQEQPKEKTEAELRAEAEKAAAEIAARSIAGAFGKGNSMENRGDATTGTGIQGSVEGNSETGEKVGGDGVGDGFTLEGRSLVGSLPKPIYNVQEEGRVVVLITVNSEGVVINAEITKGSVSVLALRKAALDAARKARFNAVNGVNNQSGTITYYFKLK